MDIALFSGDDYKWLIENNAFENNISFHLIDSNYEYRLKVIKLLDKSYNTLYGESIGKLATNKLESNIKHLVIETLKEQGYVEYERIPKKSRTD